jgi:hypothetical protein
LASDLSGDHAAVCELLDWWNRLELFLTKLFELVFLLAAQFLDCDTERTGFGLGCAVAATGCADLGHWSDFLDRVSL